MYNLKSYSTFDIKEHGTVLTVACPIAMPRNKTEMMKHLSPVEIDGEIYSPKRFETYCLQCDLREGEMIGVLV